MDLNLSSSKNCKKIKSKNVIAVNSATSGIFISLIALGAKKGDEVLTHQTPTSALFILYIILD